MYLKKGTEENALHHNTRWIFHYPELSNSDVNGTSPKFLPSFILLRNTAQKSRTNMGKNRSQANYPHHSLCIKQTKTVLSA